VRSFLLLMMIVGLAGCAEMGEPVLYQAGRDAMILNAQVDGRALVATVYIDGQPVIRHHWPPFVNSRDEQTAHYRGHTIRSVLRVIKGLASTTAQIYVKVDGEPAGEFFF